VSGLTEADIPAVVTGQDDLRIAEDARRGGTVPIDDFEDIVVRIAGYSSVSAVNPFFVESQQLCPPRQLG
jgi:hypothetical protein